jgi:hypothetical protein
MTRSASVAEIQRAGVRVEPEEAVAIAQQLIATLRDGVPPDHVEPPFGPPTVETVVLLADGSVACRGCDATPAVSEIARLLQTMLPAGASKVAGALRYTIARAMLDVDAPPFDSIDDLSDTLARFERGRRDQIVIRVLRRHDASRALVRMPIVDRRRHPQATALRRALREADARLYLQAASAPPAIIVAPPADSGGPSVSVTLACVAAGALLIAAGELMHEWRTPAAMPAPPPPIAALAQYAPPLPQRANIADAATPSAMTTTARAVTIRQTPTRQRVKRAPQVTRARGDRTRARSLQQRGVLDRLRLRWLRNVFAHRDL